MNFNFKKLEQDTLVIKIICIAWLIAKTITYKTWISDRLFPVISVFDFLSDIPNSIHLGLYFLSLVGIILIFILPKNKTIISIFLFFEISSCLLDQMRWQPWEYQYILTFVFFILSKNNKNFIHLTSILIITIYFLSGFNKFNGGFLTFFWENMFLIRVFNISKEYIQSNLWLHYLGTFLALIELFLAVGLFILKKKKTIVVLIILMHLFILFLLIPISNYNHVVWPWNIAMIILVYLLFYNDETKIFKVSLILNKINIFIFVLLLILPVSNKIGYWCNHFSFNLYSGNLNRVILCIKDFESYPRLEKFKKKSLITNCYDYNEINILKWTMNDLYVPINSDEFTCIQLKKAWLKKYPNTNIHLLLSKYPYKKEDVLEIK